MLASRIILPYMVKLIDVNIRYASCPSALFHQSAGVQNRNLLVELSRNQINLLGPPLWNPAKLTICDQPSSRPNLPSRDELERYFFKVAAVFWDLTAKILLWSWCLFKEKVIDNPTVQRNWKKFNEKLDEARK